MGPWGGLGTHRMPNGHSGDTVTSWQTLQFLPVYSATASVSTVPSLLLPLCTVCHTSVSPSRILAPRNGSLPAKSPRSRHDSDLAR